jgi:large subunit ribosomal protein L25
MEKPNNVSIDAIARQTGPNTAAEMRANHTIPAVLYGPGTDNVHFSVPELELERLLKAEDAQIVDVKIDNKSYSTIVKNVDYHPVTDRPLHADFYAFNDKHPVTISLPIRLVGSAPGVMAGGRLDHNLKKVKVRCLAQHIPAHIRADISGLNIGETLRIKELDFSNVTPLVEPDRTVVLIKPPRGSSKKADGKK